jgi:hypothetical protein
MSSRWKMKIVIDVFCSELLKICIVDLTIFFLLFIQEKHKQVRSPDEFVIIFFSTETLIFWANRKKETSCSSLSSRRRPRTVVHPPPRGPSGRLLSPAVSEREAARRGLRTMEAGGGVARVQFCKLIMIITVRISPSHSRPTLLHSALLIKRGRPPSPVRQTKTFFQYNAIQWINENEGLLVFGFCPLFKWVCVRKSVRRTKRFSRLQPPPSLYTSVFFILCD